MLNLLGTTHPFAVVRVAELDKWQRSGEYERILGGDYPRREDDPNARVTDEIKAAYAGGMKNGGSDEGAPGFRPPEAEKGFYAAYLRDPTGNKLCLFCVV